MVFYVVWGCRCVRLEVKDITQSEADALLAELLRMRNRRQDAAAAAAVDPPIIVPEAAATVTPGRGSGSATSTAPATKAAYADARGFAERTATWLTSLCFSPTLACCEKPAAALADMCLRPQRHLGPLGCAVGTSRNRGPGRACCTPHLKAEAALNRQDTHAAQCAVGCTRSCHLPDFGFSRMHM